MPRSSRLRKSTVRPMFETLEDRTAPAGDFGLALRFSARDADNGDIIATDAAGNVFVAGDFFNDTTNTIAIDFDPGAGVANVASNSNINDFIAKYTPDGALAWAYRWDGGDPAHLATDAAGNVFIASSFSNTRDFDPGPGVSTMTSAGGSSDLAITKLTGAGAFVWARRFGSLNAEHSIAGLSVDASGNVVFTGPLEGSIDFDPGPGFATLARHTYQGFTSDSFLVKLNSSGNLVWARNLGGIVDEGIAALGSVYAMGAELDAVGNVYVAGIFQGEIGDAVEDLTASGNRDLFVWKLNAAAVSQWMVRINLDDGLEGAGYHHGTLNDFDVDGGGHVVLMGNFSGSAHFEATSALTNPVVSETALDHFLYKINPFGNPFWLRQFRAPFLDANNAVVQDVLKVDAAGAVYTAGRFKGTVDLEPGAGTTSLTAGGVADDLDFYVTRLHSDGAFDWARGFGDGQVHDIDAHDGNVWTTGHFTGAVDFDPGPDTFIRTSNRHPDRSYFTRDIFISKLTPVPLPALSINDRTLTEANSGTTAYTFTVTLSAPSDQTVTVHYTTVNNSAVAPSDFTAVSGTLTFSPGQVTKTVTVQVVGDTAVEADERFFVRLSSPTNARIIDADGIGVIDNNDLPTLRVSDTREFEGTINPKRLYFTIQLSAPYSEPVTVRYRTANGTAVAGVDYTALQSTLTFQAGSIFESVEVPIRPDAAIEANETVRFLLEAPANATLADALGVGTILNDDIAGVAPGVGETSSQPGWGVGTLQYTPSGQLAQVLWENDVLTYRTRLPNGTWARENIGPTGGGRFDISHPSRSAVLLFSPDGTPNVLVEDGPLIVHYVKVGGAWTTRPVPNQNFPELGFFGRIGQMVGAVGPGGKLHVILTGDGLNGQRVPLYYGTNKTGVWQWRHLRSVGTPYGWATGEMMPRYVSLAVDAQNFAHITFAPEFQAQATSPGGPSRLYSELWYTTNRTATGVWASRKVYGGADNSADAGLAASIAINPLNNQPTIASYYAELVPTGSPQETRLMYHVRRGDGSWHSTVITNQTAGFRADNFAGTGFAPDLKFDHRGRPHIAFLDDAIIILQGFKTFVAGQLRYARFDGTRWVLQTIVPLRDPYVNEMHLPVLALSRTEVSFRVFRQHYEIVAGQYLPFNYFVQVSRPLA